MSTDMISQGHCGTVFGCSGVLAALVTDLVFWHCHILRHTFQCLFEWWASSILPKSGLLFFLFLDVLRVGDHGFLGSLFLLERHPLEYTKDLCTIIHFLFLSIGYFLWLSLW